MDLEAEVEAEAETEPLSPVFADFKGQLNRKKEKECQYLLCDSQRVKGSCKLYAFPNQNDPERLQRWIYNCGWYIFQLQNNSF